MSSCEAPIPITGSSQHEPQLLPILSHRYEFHHPGQKRLHSPSFLFFASKSLCLAFALTPATHLTYQLCMQLPTRSQRERATPPSTSLQNLVSSLRYFLIVRLALALSAEAPIPSIRESSQRKLLLTYVLALVRLPVTWATSRSSALELHLSLLLTVLSCFFPQMFEL